MCIRDRSDTISLISHPSKIMLGVILNQLKAKAEELLAEEQAGFRAGWSTVEQVFKSQDIIEKYLQHQHDLFHNFIDFNKVFDRVWHIGLWQVLRSFSIDGRLVQAIQAELKQCNLLQSAKGVFQDNST